MTPKLSIIIPCYNQGHFLDECLESVYVLANINIAEIIVINDGSIDENTLNIISSLNVKYPLAQIINQTNKGLATARNNGVSISKGKYILPLDADNKINTDYVYKAIEILEKNDADIVYAKPIFFGENIVSRKFSTNEFDGIQILTGNFIDACAIYNRKVWVKNEGYDKNMPFCGVEDWEFWINSFKNKFKFHFIDEELYYYRVSSNSMISETILNDKDNKNFEYIITKHWILYIETIGKLNYYKKRMEFEEENPIRTMLKYFVRIFKQ